MRYQIFIDRIASVRLLYMFLLFIPFLGNAQKKIINKNPPAINDILILPSISTVNYIYKGNHIQPDSDGNKQAQKTLGYFLKQAIPDSIKAEFIMYDSSHQSIYDSAIVQMLADTNKAYKKGGIQIPQFILDTMAAHNANYSMGFFYTSFQRTEKNMTNQIIKDGILSYALTLGGLTVSPYEFGSGMVCYIIDYSNKKLIYLNSHFLYNRSPSDKYVMKEHLYYLLLHFFN